MKFTKVIASVLARLGISAFDKEDGKSILSEEQKEKLQKVFGKTFVDKFTADLTKYEDDGGDYAGVEEMRLGLEGLQSEFDQFKIDASEREKNLNAVVETLSKEPEKELKSEKPTGGRDDKKVFARNMNYIHNKVMDNYISGDGMMALAATTIDTDELRTEFGKYVNDVRNEIIHQLFGQITCTQYMTTKMTEFTEYRAAQDVITTVIQQFTSFWTPKGSTTFTPIVIKNMKHKINLPIKPAEVMTELLGYMYDEGMQPKDMPIVKYIINVLLKPKVDEEREELMATGVFEEFSPEGGLRDGVAGQESGKSMDGYCTILKKEKAKEDTKVNFLLDGVQITSANIIEKFEAAVDSISAKFKKKAMCMHIDPDLVTMYNRAYQEKFKNALNADTGRQRIDFSKITFAPIDGMIGTGMFFITPKENFIHLLSKNRGLNNVFIQAENYDVKVFAEWWEAVGFAIAEAVFAYVPQGEIPAGSDGGQTA